MKRVIIKTGVFAVTLFALSVSATQSLAQSNDRVRHRNGIDRGEVTKTTALGVTLSRGGVERTFPGEEILSITFTDEPDQLAPARRDVAAGRFRDALAKLEQIDRSKIERNVIAQDFDFLTTLCRAETALATGEQLAEAQREITGFLSANNRSYHVPHAIELLGEVLLASGDSEAARAQYAKLGKPKVPFYRARSALLVGKSWQTEDKHKEAIGAFDEAIREAGESAAAQPVRLEATLARAVSQAATGKLEMAVGELKQILLQSSDEDTELIAQAYNALGDCYLQAEDKQAARLAYLHVDLLYAEVSTAHAKALYELSQLWKEKGLTNRAEEAHKQLQTEYPESSWANR